MSEKSVREKLNTKKRERAKSLSEVNMCLTNTCLYASAGPIVFTK